MLAAGYADRVGLWLPGSRRGQPGAGCVVEAKAGPIPEQWKLLDVSAPFLRAALESPDPLRVDLVADEATPQLGPLVGMTSAVWVPLRAGDRTVGLCLVGYLHAPQKLEMEAIRSMADPARQELHWLFSITAALPATNWPLKNCAFSSVFHVRFSPVSRLISILSQIARAARNCVQAEFIALGTGSSRPAGGAGWDGAAGWLGAMRQESFAQVWRKVLKEGRKMEVSGVALAKLLGVSKEVSHLSLDSLVAIPIEIRGATGGVFMAGLSRPENSGEDVAALESYVLLAATALDRDVARAELKASGDAYRKMIESSRECLLLMDDQGKILETSCAAAALLFAPWSPMDGTFLEELFFPVMRDAITEWRMSLHTAEMASAQIEEHLEPVVEGTLERGGNVRMRKRSEVPAIGGQGRKWLIYLEESEARQAPRDAEVRLEAEMAGPSSLHRTRACCCWTPRAEFLLASERLAAIFGIRIGPHDGIWHHSCP